MKIDTNDIINADLKSLVVLTTLNTLHRQARKPHPALFGLNNVLNVIFETLTEFIKDEDLKVLSMNNRHRIRKIVEELEMIEKIALRLVESHCQENETAGDTTSQCEQLKTT